MRLALLSIAILLNHSDCGSSIDFRKFQVRMGGDNCKSPKDIMQEETKQTILKEFNKKRKEVAKEVTDPLKFPVAFPMSDLEWELELEKDAKTLAMMCPLVPLVHFNVTYIGQEKIGQSIVLKIWDSEPPKRFPIESLIKRYSSAVRRMDWRKITALIKKYESGDWDSGFQILWANTTKVGCSYVTFKVPPPSEYPNELSLNVLVCYFRPSGCIPDEQVYRIKTEPRPPKTTTREPRNHSPIVGLEHSFTVSVVMMSMYILYITIVQ